MQPPGCLVSAGPHHLTEWPLQIRWELHHIHFQVGVKEDAKQNGGSGKNMKMYIQKPDFRLRFAT